MIAGVAGPKAPMVGIIAQTLSDKDAERAVLYSDCLMCGDDQPKYGQPVAPNLNVRHLCPNCRNDPPNIIEEYSKGDLVCGDCGTILGDRIVDTRSECEFKLCLVAKFC